MKIKNGQLKPGYNVQTDTENQFVVGFSIHPYAADTSCLKEHLEGVKKAWDTMPKRSLRMLGTAVREIQKYNNRGNGKN